MKRGIGLAVLMFAGVAWGQAPATQPAERVSGATLEQMHQSLRALADSLPQEKRAEFDQAVSAIMAKYRQEFEERLRRELDGKTAEQIIAAGESYAQANPRFGARFAQASQEARVSATRSIQQTVRAQSELYKLQHNERYPDFAKHQWAQLTGRTTEAGELTESNERGRIFGPYLMQPPVNQLRSASKVLVVQESAETLKPVTDKEIGFIVTPDGRFYALDENGKPME